MARADILDGLECTTHWKYIEALQQHSPKVKVMRNQLFVKNDTVYTSAGITTGINLTLFLMGERHGAKLALTDNQFYYSLLGNLYTGIDNAKAIKHFQTALKLANSVADKAIIERNIEKIMP